MKYDSGEIPEDFSRSVFVSLYKMLGENKCMLYRPSSLMSHITKLIIRIPKKRTHKIFRAKIGQEQSGFLNVTGMRNAFSKSHKHLEGCLDCAKDSIRYDTKFNSFRKDRIIQKSYWVETAYTRIENGFIKFTNEA